jgi:non-homologous end joining protein Ku
MPAWKGALDYRGFPINVTFFAQKKSSRGQSLKMIGPDGQPPVSKSYEASTMKEITAEQVGRAVSIGRGKAAVLHPLSPEATEQIGAGTKTRVIEVDTFVNVTEIPLELALMSYVVTPDTDVAGSDRSAKLLWNGLRKTGLAYVAQATISSRDSIVAVYATETQLKAVSLPFVQELYPEPAYEWEVDTDMADVFASTLQDAYEVTEFEHRSYTSQYEARRQDVIDQVLAGKYVAPAAAPAAKDEGPDLMALLQAASKKPAKKPAAKTTKKKVTV